MRRKSNALFIITTICLQLIITGCSGGTGSNTVPNDSTVSNDSVVETKGEETAIETTIQDTSEAETTDTSSNVVVDYGNAEAFEAALNAGENLEGKIVKFTVTELNPDSQLGFMVYAGEHLNFVSSDDPGFKVGDAVTVKTNVIKNVLGSWVISYDKCDNANVGESTITEVETAEPEDTGTYESNPYYDIVETAVYKNSIGRTIVIHKLNAKKDASISGSVLAYASDGSVIGKSEDDIVLTEGQSNYFKYSFDGDISNADLQTQYSVKNNSFMQGERNAVEMVQYNQSGNDLYITFKQVADNLGSFAKFKLLFYKGDTITATEESYFSTSTKNMNGKDTSDVASVMVYGIDFDRVEYIFEP